MTKSTPLSNEVAGSALRSPQESLRLHRCRVCGTRWLLWPAVIHGGGWNLLDKYQRPGSCCDNAAMAEQIEHLRDFDLAVSVIAGTALEGAQGKPASGDPRLAATSEHIDTANPSASARGSRPTLTPGPSVAFYEERARWYRDGCEGLEDRDGYRASGDLEKDAASDLLALCVRVRDLEAALLARDEVRSPQAPALPLTTPRAETGPMQFPDDWPGVFLRGDSALHFAFTLRQFLAHPHPLNAAVLAGYANVLEGCDARLKPETQRALLDAGVIRTDEWKQAAQLLGECLAADGPNGYYAFTAGEWRTWAVSTVAALRLQLTEVRTVITALAQDLMKAYDADDKLALFNAINQLRLRAAAERQA